MPVTPDVIRDRPFPVGGALAYVLAPSPLGGWVLLAATPQGICALTLGDDPGTLAGDLRQRFRGVSCAAGGEGLTEWTARLCRVLTPSDTPASRGEELERLPLDLYGTAFQQRVWAALRQIPAGQTTTYAALAAAIGAPASVRAVANACGANPVSVLVPCHRVIRSDGALSGYRWGVARKRALLALEAGNAREVRNCE